MLFAGEDMFARSEAGLTRFRRQDVGFVFQFYNLLAEMTALENTMVPALLAAALRARGPQRARPTRWPRWGWPIVSATGRESCPEASSSGWPSRARS